MKLLLYPKGLLEAAVTPQIRPNVCGVAPRWLRI